MGRRGTTCVNDAVPAIRILVVDDHPMLRAGIAAIVDAQSDMRLVAEASDGREAVEQFRRHVPDVTLMDLQMPVVSGVDAIRTIRAEFPTAVILVLTTYAGDVQALTALKAGAQGFLLKSALRKELIDTVRALHGGNRWIQPQVATDIAEHAIDDPLTARELAVLACVAQGNSNKIVGQLLAITDDTVKAHMKSILAKLDARDRTHAVVIAIARGILQS
jgi:DNA-binding NarL/FixJ family response regulator